MQLTGARSLRTYFVSVAILSLSLLLACQHKPADDGGSQSAAAPHYQNYYLTDDNWPYKRQHEADWNIALSKCGMLGEAQIDPTREACFVDLIRQSLPDNDFAEQYCASIESYVAHAGCLISVSLSIDMQRRAETESEYAVVRGVPNTGYPWALGNAATNLAGSIWQECSNAAAKRTCREAAAARRLGMNSVNQANCSKWEQDAEAILCLFRLHIAHRMVEATRRIESL